MADVNAILESIKGLTLLEAAQLVKGIEEAFGVSAAAAAVAAAPAAGGGAAAAPAGAASFEPQTRSEPNLAMPSERASIFMIHLRNTRF